MKKLLFLFLLSLILILIYKFAFHNEELLNIKDSNIPSFIEEETILNEDSALESEIVMEGDIVINEKDPDSDEVVSEIIDMKQNKESNIYQFSGFTSNFLKLWENGQVYYMFDSGDFTSGEQDFIRVAMKEWEDASNNKVSFHEKPNTLFRRLAWRLGSSRVIRIMKARRSSATLGQLPYGRIKLSPYALTQKHIVLHELGHILGLLHVHQRPDRDNYILVNKEKLFDSNLMKIHDQYWRLLGLIIPGRKGSNYYTDNYDFDSIMHYRNVTYSDGNHRFTDLEGNFIEVGGVEISSMDALAIQNLYSR